MADVLKGTLWWGSNPAAFTIDDIGGTGAFIGRAMTAAEAHDALDTTYEGLNDTGDGVSADAVADAYGSALLTACPAGGIKFVRVKLRARVVLGGAGVTGFGTVQPWFNGVPQGTPATLTNAFANYQFDFPTNPNGAMWTKAIIDGLPWGFFMNGSASNGGFNANFDLRVAEMTVEIWGQDIIATTTPAESIGEVVDQSGLVVTNDVRDPTVDTALGVTLDQTSNLVTVRSFKASLSDQTVATKDVFTSPASWPNSGTQLQPLYGTASQGVQGSSGAGNGINGTGLISGIKLFALVRVSKSSTATAPTNVRFGTAMGTKALVTSPTVRDIAALDDTMWEVVNTALITTGQFANPFTWGNGTDSVWASLFGWTFNHTYSNDVTPKTTQVEVAEAWVEIYGPVGSQPILIELTHALGIPVKQQALEGTF
jgi:hypothetical protein